MEERAASGASAWCPAGIDITQEVSALADLLDAATANDDENGDGDRR
jgi:hypothetical protein